MTRYLWRVVIELKVGFNPVSIDMYRTSNYEDAFEYLETRRYLENKRRHVFVKQVGSKHRHYHYDERFAAELLTASDTDSDAYYEEPTTDERAIVQVHRRTFKPAIWRGIRRNS